MAQRIHMHDQVFNKVDDIMRHYEALQKKAGRAVGAASKALY